MSTTYDHVSPRDLEVIEAYRDHFANTGGNDPADLLNDMQRPSTPERANHMASTNIVRFTLAVGIQGQVALLHRLERDGKLVRPAPTKET